MPVPTMELRRKFDAINDALAIVNVCILRVSTKCLPTDERLPSRNRISHLTCVQNTKGDVCQGVLLRGANEVNTRQPQRATPGPEIGLRATRQPTSGRGAPASRFPRRWR